MGSSTRLIKRRIKSITNTKKITRAMELVAASKMRRAVSSVVASRPYADAAWTVIRELAKVTEAEKHPLLQTNAAADRVLMLLFSSDRGLCGGFNAQLLRLVKKFVDGLPEGVTIDFVTVGRKGQDGVRRLGANIVATFTDVATYPSITDIRPIADIAINDFIAGKYHSVFLAFTDFVSTLVQRPRISQLLPLMQVEGLGEALVEGERRKDSVEKLKLDEREYLFEPTPEAVLETMLPRLVEAQVFQAMLETSASEYSARMMAMRNATEAATEMIGSLTLEFNRTRQAGITAEIAEISSGKAALEK